jgi:hypothetical protein
MPEPTDMMVPLLREMREEIGSRFDRVDACFDIVECRLKNLEELQVSDRRALTADTLLSKLVTGEFAERIEALEFKVRELESQK